MFIDQFFKGNPNFVVLEMLEAILKVQVYLENNLLRDTTTKLNMNFRSVAPFLKSRWVLEISSSTSNMTKFEFPLKNWPINMYHMYVFKI